MFRQTAVERPLSSPSRRTPRRTARLLLSGLSVLAVSAAVATTAGSAAQAADGSAPAAPTVSSVSSSSPAAATAAPAARQKKGGTVYYVSPTGSDANTGSSRAAAVRSLARVSELPLKAGDKVLLKKGAAYAGPLDIVASGVPGKRIKVGAFGKNPDRPSITGCLTIRASWVRVSGLQVADCATGAITVWGRNNIVQRSTVTGSWAGIEVMESAVKTKILRNDVVDNTRMVTGTGDNDDNGAFGVLVHGDNTEVAYNTISGQVANSPDYGTDGSAVEIYGGIGTYVHHNVARNNKAFTELGNKRTANTRYEYNVSTSSVPFSEFLVTRGADDFFGPIPGTVASNNTVRNTGNGSQGFYCYGGCSPSVMTLNNNIFDISGRIGYADGPFGGGGNIYWGGGSLETPLLAGDKYTDPRFVNSQLTGGDFHVASSSPAIDTGSTNARGTDLGGRQIPLDGNGDGRAAADAGAYETAAN